MIKIEEQQLPLLSISKPWWKPNKTNIFRTFLTDFASVCFPYSASVCKFSDSLTNWEIIDMDAADALGKSNLQPIVVIYMRYKDKLLR